MNIHFRRTATVFAMVVLAGSTVLAASSTWTLVPGKQAGSLKLRSYPAGLPLGKPDYSDAAMSHYVYLWVSKERNSAGMPLNTVVAASTSNSPVNGGPGETVTNVRVTSPLFHDENGLSTGSTLASIRRIYRHLAPVDSNPDVLADDARGIGFEFSGAHPSTSSRCVAIDIYSPGGNVRFDASDVHGMVEEWKNQPAR